MRLTVKEGKETPEVLSRLKGQIRGALGSHIYYEGDATLEEVVGQLLLAKQQTLALAESCTGGYISHRITRVAGSSAYYYGGAVTYSNDAKMRFLGVDPATLESHGAVSRETALEMSRGIRERTGASIGLSVTGVAGPSGGSPEKPVGTVWISIAKLVSMRHGFSTFTASARESFSGHHKPPSTGCGLRSCSEPAEP